MSQFYRMGNTVVNVDDLSSVTNEGRNVYITLKNGERIRVYSSMNEEDTEMFLDGCDIELREMTS
ncbi:MAG: hypothetical protein ACWGQW_04300 [bacterium]